MNERIKELASQSNFNWFLSSGNISTDNTIHDLEKFAELIVAECASTILNNDIEKPGYYDHNSPFFSGWERGVIDSAQIIKQHFGIEE